MLGCRHPFSSHSLSRAPKEFKGISSISSITTETMAISFFFMINLL